jgi:exonuclease III
MNIIQWNIDGFYKRNIDIQRLISNHKPNIIYFQETNLKHSQSCHIKNYNGYFKNRINPGRASGGVAIFIKDNIENNEIILNTHLEAIEMSAKLNNKNFCICNIYLPDSTPFT